MSREDQEHVDFTQVKDQGLNIILEMLYPSSLVTDSLADFEGDRNDQRLEENQGRAAEGNIIKEDILKEQTGRPAEGNRTSEDLLKEQLEMLMGMMRFLDKYDEDAGRAAEGTLRREDLLKKQIEREAQGNRTQEDIVKDQIEMLTGMKRLLDKHEKDAVKTTFSIGTTIGSSEMVNGSNGASSESLLRMTNLAKEQINRLLRTARETVDPTVQNTTGKTDDWKDFEDFCKGQIDLMNAFREIHHPTVEKIKGRLAEGMELVADMYQKFLDKLAALKEAEYPTEEDNKGLLLDVMGILQDFMTAQISKMKLVPYILICRFS